VAESFREWKRAELSALDDAGLMFATLACLRALSDGWTAGRAWACDDCRYTWQDRDKEARYEEAVGAVNQERRGLRDWNRRQMGSNTNQAGERTMSGKQNGTAMTAATTQAGAAELAIVHGDLGKLSEGDRLTYYNRVCESLGLNPLTKPFGYLVLQGKTQLYALRTAADQLRKIHGVSVIGIKQEESGGVLTVTVEVRDREGRTDVEIGCVAIEGLKGENLANARMKALTKSKRRATLSLCGLGWLDETEVDSIPGAKVVDDPASVPPAAPARVQVITTRPEPQQPKGADIATRLRAKEAMLVGEGVCGEGELVAHVTKAMVKAGFEQDPGVWAEAEIKQTAFPAAKEFEDRKRAVAKAKHVVAGKQKGDAYEGDPEPEEVGARR
jgi:hypothetical protein